MGSTATVQGITPIGLWGSCFWLPDCTGLYELSLYLFWGESSDVTLHVIHINIHEHWYSDTELIYELICCGTCIVYKLLLKLTPHFRIAGLRGNSVSARRSLATESLRDLGVHLRAQREPIHWLPESESRAVSLCWPYDLDHNIIQCINTEISEFSEQGVGVCFKLRMSTYDIWFFFGSLRKTRKPSAEVWNAW